MRSSSPTRTVLLSVLVATGALAFASGCELPDRKKNRRKDSQKVDARYVKDLSKPGPWVCTLAFDYSSAESAKSSSFDSIELISEAEDGIRVVSKLKEACAALEAAPKKICEREIAADRFACANAPKFLPIYTEIASATGNWTCEMPYSYTVAIEPKKPTKAEKAAEAKKASDAKKAAEAKKASNAKKAGDAGKSSDDGETTEAEAEPSPVPSPTPQTRVVNEVLRADASTAIRAASDAMSECLAIKQEASRTACALGLTTSPAKMRCWNRDLGPDARPRRKVTRRP